MNNYLSSIKHLSNQKAYQNFVNRIKQNSLTRDENARSHFCVYFAGIDLQSRQVFIGHHKKSDLWLFSGGHIDKDETPHDAVIREISEEWGVNVSCPQLPELLTISTINNPRISCTTHFDIWYFVRLNKDDFKPPKELLNLEFHTIGWYTLSEARRLSVNPVNFTAIEFIESKLFCQ